MSTTQIRRGTAADINIAVEMGERFYATTSYRNWAPFCRESSAATVALIIENGVLLIAERNGRPIGMAGLFLAPFMFNRSIKGAHEVFWWIEPEFRGALTAWRLLKEVKKACAEEGCSAIQMCSLPTSPAQADALYALDDYRLTEKSFTKILRSA